MRRNPIVHLVYSMGSKYPTPTNLNYMWNFGVFALISLVMQIITGILLVMFYCPNIDLAFLSVEHIMRDIPHGWLLRYLHANGASVFFIVVYAHIGRGLIYGSYLGSRALLWCSGVVIFLLMILTAFLGYILPWGQMSLWGATVITNLASTVPVVGDDIVLWLWGGFSVANPTLNKFFSLHYLFPFIILGLVALHLLLLHTYGSNNPVGIDNRVDKVTFAPYYTMKDLFSLFPYFALVTILVFFIPNTLGHPDNYIPANGDVTPEHIVPEWYFLPFYAILRSIPDKALGVIALLASIIMLGLLPFLHVTNIRVSRYKPVFYIFLLGFLADVVILTYIGNKPIEYPYVLVGQIATAYYFGFILSTGLYFRSNGAAKNNCQQGTKISPLWLIAPQISLIQPDINPTLSYSQMLGLAVFAVFVYNFYPLPLPIIFFYKPGYEYISRMKEIAHLPRKDKEKIMDYLMDLERYRQDHSAVDNAIYDFEIKRKIARIAAPKDVSVYRSEIDMMAHDRRHHFNHCNHNDVHNYHDANHDNFTFSNNELFYYPDYAIFSMIPNLPSEVVLGLLILLLFAIHATFLRILFYGSYRI